MDNSPCYLMVTVMGRDDDSATVTFHDSFHGVVEAFDGAELEGRDDFITRLMALGPGSSTTHVCSLVVTVVMLPEETKS